MKRQRRSATPKSVPEVQGASRAALLRRWRGPGSSLVLPAGIAAAILASGCSTPKNPYLGATSDTTVYTREAPPAAAPVAPPAAPVAPPPITNVVAEVVTLPESNTTASAIGGEIFDVLPPAPTNKVAESLPPAAAPPTRWGTGWIPVERVASETGLGKAQKTVIAGTARYTMPTRNGTFVFTMGSRQAKLNGLNIWLGFAAQVVHGQPCLHALDAEKIIQPLSQVSVITAPSRTIVLDPGHGGVDGGSRGIRGEKEKEFTLDWALRTERLLTNAGWHVILTRRADVDVPLLERVAISERAKADLFISFHFNSAAPHPGPSGIETFCTTPVGMLSTLSRGYPDDPRYPFPNNTHDRANMQLAAKLHAELVKETRALDDGIKHARFMAVLRNQSRPAVLIEGGYLSNPAEMTQISSSRYRQRLADAVFRALNQ